MSDVRHNTDALNATHNVLDRNDVRALLAAHPNDVEHPLDVGVDWLAIVRFYNSHHHPDPLPPHLVELINAIRHVQLPRTPINMPHPLLPTDKGMSPKKSHEVTRMAAYIAKLLAANATDPTAVRIVDVGAGQVRYSQTVRITFLKSILGVSNSCAKASAPLYPHTRLGCRPRTDPRRSALGAA